MAIAKSGSSQRPRSVLGVATCLARGSVPRHAPFGNQTVRFRSLCRDAGKYGFTAFVFVPEDVDVNSMRIFGRTYLPKSRKWVRRSFRFPDVVYNRVPTRKLELDHRVRLMFDVFRREGVPFFNTRYLNKYEVYRVAKSSSTIAAHVPDTRRLRSIKDFEEMLSRYKTVYLKKSDGTLGNGIGVVRLVGKDMLFSSNRTKRGINERRLSKSKLASAVSSYLRRKTYLIQQGIDLTRYKGRPFDFRVMVQKRGDGQWHLTGAGTRVAGPNQITTHVPRGGSRLSFSQGIARACGGDQKTMKKVLSLIRRLCCETAREVEQALGLHLAEASFDVGVDTSGRTWLIEMNSKPFLFDEKNIQTRARRYLLEYARRVARQRRNATRSGEVWDAGRQSSAGNRDLTLRGAPDARRTEEVGS